MGVSKRDDGLDDLLERARGLSGADRDAFLGKVEEELGARMKKLLASETLAGDPGGDSYTEDPAGTVSGEFASAVMERLADPEGSRYRVLEELARGGQGVILRVRDERLGRDLAMKLILDKREPSGVGSNHDTRTLGRFLEEAQVTGRLDHPGVVPVHELGLDRKGQVYFTMKLVKGEDLGTIFGHIRAGREGWTQARALRVMLRICEAMAYAHSKGVIHRDLKPSNVMVGRFGEVYVMDWGLARVVGHADHKNLRILPQMTTSAIRSERREEAPDSPLITMDGDVVGTPIYMSPEQARGDLEAMGPHSDVYSLGAMLYELLAGRRPYVDRDMRLSNYAIWYRVQEGPPRPLAELARDQPAELVAICDKAMARDPAARYADTAAMAEDLAAFLEQRVVSAYETGAVAELRKWVQRNRGLARALASAIVLLVAGLVTSLFLKAKADWNAELAAQRHAGILRLGAFQRLEDLTREADRLWPPDPVYVDAYRAWLARADELIAGLEPNADDPLGHRAQLAELRARALPPTDEDRQRAMREHPRFSEWQQLQARLAAARAAQAVRDGAAPPAEASVEPELLLEVPATQIAHARALVDPERVEFGNEALGLSLARDALERAEDEDTRARAATVLAWALFAVGRDAEALSTLDAASSTGDERLRSDLTAERERLRAAVEGAPSELAALERDGAALAEEMAAATPPRFANEDDTWWFNQLTKLIAAIEAFADPATGLYEGVSPVHGWGIQRRLAFALTVDERSLTGEDVARRWRVAIASIANPAECPLYTGLAITPQRGLVPLGRDPDSGLWEFAHLMSGEPALRGPDGRLHVTEETGIVLVLLPGGRFLMGAQSTDENGPNYDPEAEPRESPVHEVELSPFFLSKYEMTQGQWLRIMGANPSRNAPATYDVSWDAGGKGADLLHPVESIGWTDCVEACRRTGLCVPTEAQWEYGARGGTTTPWSTGDERATLKGAANLADRFAFEHDGTNWATDTWLDDGYTVHAPVTSFAPNPFGLYDVHGNVWEICNDAWDEGFYARSPVRDPENPPAGSSLRVQRGGGYGMSATHARSARRGPESFGETTGLRPGRKLTR